MISASWKVFLDVLDEKNERDSNLLEECIHCRRKFRFDRIAKHEARCPESKAKPVKLDVAAKILAGTPGEHHIPEVRQQLLMGVKLPPLKVQNDLADQRQTGGQASTPGNRSLLECKRCSRRFSSDALEKHSRHCTARASSRSNSRPSRPSSGRLRPSSRDGRNHTVPKAIEPKILAYPNPPSYEELEVDVAHWLDD